MSYSIFRLARPIWMPLRKPSRREKGILRKAETRNRGRNITLIATLHSEYMGPSVAVEEAATREVFEVYVENFWGPALRLAQIVVITTWWHTNQRGSGS